MYVESGALVVLGRTVSGVLRTRGVKRIFEVWLSNISDIFITFAKEPGGKGKENCELETSLRNTRIWARKIQFSQRKYKAVLQFFPPEKKNLNVPDIALMILSKNTPILSN